ncbi:MAG TPA: phosphomannomutase/phosphoglucomutase [Candidatus Kapabacteria bacterium]|nr:phosphomannomutase/phosphoglucomutase [Candidatus Kapabacteria bacterium]
MTTSTEVTIPEHIFKAYDIRGLVKGELSEELAYRLGRAFIIFLRSQATDLTGKKIVVGHDMRPTSVPFQAAVIRGMIDEGIDVVDIGLTSTPLFNFACAHYPEHAGGIMVTASHNPAEYNGFKMTLGNGMPIGKESGMSEIKRLVVTREKMDIAHTPGSVVQKQILTDYMQRIFSLVPKESISPMKIVIDYGNGMGSVSVPEVLKELPVTVVSLYETPDGTFPNHEANPLKVETLTALQAKVREEKADFGFALDGDADRIGLVDERGDVVDPSIVGALLGLEVLRTHKTGHMLYDLRSSRIVKDTWEKAGATTGMCRVGHALIKKQMKETSTLFASELSLHLYYHDMYDVESNDLSLVYVLHMLSREKKPLSQLVDALKVYAHSGEINFEVEDKEGAMKRVEDAYRTSAKEISHLDGIWMSFDWGWLNVRPSNTEPILRLNLETKTKEETERRVEEVKKLLIA